MLLVSSEPSPIKKELPWAVTNVGSSKVRAVSGKGLLPLLVSESSSFGNKDKTSNIVSSGFSKQTNKKNIYIKDQKYLVDTVSALSKIKIIVFAVRPF